MTYTDWMHEPDQEGPVVGALDAQLDLRRWWKTPYGQEFGDGFGQSVATQMLGAALQDVTDGASPEQLEEIVNRPQTKVTIAHAMMAREIAKHEIDTLGRAATFYVTEEMVNEIGEAAASIPDGLVIEPRMLPASHGFVMLATPLNVIDKNGHDFAVPVFTWGSDEGTDGVDFCSYSDPHDPRDPHPDVGQHPRSSPLMLLHIDGLAFGDSLGKHFGVDRPGSRNERDALSVEQWARGEIDEAQFIDAVGFVPAAMASAKASVKWLVAFWTITNERLPVFHRLPVRQQRREMQRRLPEHPDECSIRVVDLRAYDYPEGEEHDPAERFWSHRWRVRGHWRVLHRGQADERHVWVEGYIKGPPDAPLIERDFVFRVRR